MPIRIFNGPLKELFTFQVLRLSSNVLFVFVFVVQVEERAEHNDKEEEESEDSSCEPSDFRDSLELDAECLIHSHHCV